MHKSNHGPLENGLDYLSLEQNDIPDLNAPHNESLPSQNEWSFSTYPDWLEVETWNSSEVMLAVGDGIAETKPCP